MIWYEHVYFIDIKGDIFWFDKKRSPTEAHTFWSKLYIVFDSKHVLPVFNAINWHANCIELWLLRYINIVRRTSNNEHIHQNLAVCSKVISRGCIRVSNQCAWVWLFCIYEVTMNMCAVLNVNSSAVIL